MSFRQGRELFESATKSDYMTQPIQIYYGMLAFMRAMMMMSERSITESNLTQNHGVKLKDAPLTGDTEKILGTKIVYESGAFSEWYRLSQNWFPMRVRSSEADWSLGYETDISGKAVTLKQILKLIPEVWQELEMVDGQKRAWLSITGYTSDTFSFNGKVAQSQVMRCLPGISETKVNGINNQNWNANTSEVKNFTPQLAQMNQDGFNIGSTLLVPPINGIRLSPLAAYITIGYTLSIFARYRPLLWGSIWTGGKGNETYPLFSQAMSTMLNWFPYMVSENLKHYRIHHG